MLPRPNIPFMCALSWLVQTAFEVLLTVNESLWVKIVNISLSTLHR